MCGRSVGGNVKAMGCSVDDLFLLGKILADDDSVVRFRRRVPVTTDLLESANKLKSLLLCRGWEAENRSFSSARNFCSICVFRAATQISMIITINKHDDFDLEDREPLELESIRFMVLKTVSSLKSTSCLSPAHNNRLDFALPFI